jgi:iron complex transport system substrate-binding protein
MLERLICILVLCLSCGQSFASITVLDDQMRPVRLSAPAQRIVSLLPSLTETVCALGQCHRLVGLDRYSNWPAQTVSLPRMGGGLDPDIESIVAQKPDLVLLAGSTRGIERLQAMGIVVLRLEPRTHADVLRVLRTVAQAMGVAAAEGDRVWASIEVAMQSAAQMLGPRSRRVRVYVEVGPTPFGASEASFIGETLRLFGVDNILPASMGPFPQVNPEFVVRAQPDVILAGDSSRQVLEQRPGWQQLQAVRERRICFLPSDQADVLVRPGPRMAEGARLMAQCIVRTGGLR